MPGNALMCLHRHSRLVNDCRAQILLLSSDGVKMTNTVNTSALSIGYIAGGPPNGSAVVLLHGWPDDALTWNGVAPALHTAGLRTYAPYLRGFGPTRFNDASIKRSGQLSALGADVIAFADALKLQRFAVIGHDWGARAAYIAAALWPERITSIVALSVGWGTNDPNQTISLRQTQNYWYHWYMALPRGAALVERERREFTRYIWDIWCPHWKLSAPDFDATATSFENPDWAEVVIHSYRHRWGYAEGDPTFDALERRLTPPPLISVPTLVLHGEDDPCNTPTTSESRERFFSGRYERKVLPHIGHFPQREEPHRIAEEIIAWLSM
jgi:pimeloyl-ACP methyl ester carboxylesterase